jgi:endonuclease/exonuclease/phosphatase family metal-dependent hydrolase
LALLPGCLLFSSDAESKSSLVILSWNVWNYNLSDRVVEGVFRREYPKPETQKAAMRELIARENPDLMIFQEVGGIPYVVELSHDLKVEHEMEYPYWGEVTGEDTVRKVVFLSRKPVIQRENELSRKGAILYQGQSRAVRRGLLELELSVAGRELSIFGFHLKSRLTEEKADPSASDLREREARAIRNYLRSRIQEDPEMLILAIGDLNDHAGSAAYARFTKLNRRPLLHEVRGFDSRGECWTYFHERDRRYEQIDFAFASAGLRNNPAWIIECSIPDDAMVLKASDHRPLLLHLRFNPDAEPSTRLP